MKKILTHSFYPITEAAQTIGTTSEEVRSYLKSGQLASCNIGEDLYISDQSLADFLHPDTPRIPDPEFVDHVRMFLARYAQTIAAEGKETELKEAVQSWLEASTRKGKELSLQTHSRKQISREPICEEQNC